MHIYKLLKNKSRYVCRSQDKPLIADGLDDRGSVPGREIKGYFSSPPLPHRLWCPQSHLCSRYRELFPLM